MSNIWWPFRYRQLQESLTELVVHLQRNNLKIPNPLNIHINTETPAQLESCISVLTESIPLIKNSEFLEQKVTKILLEQFIVDAEYLKTALEKEIKTNPEGINNYILEINNHLK